MKDHMKKDPAGINLKFDILDEGDLKSLECVECDEQDTNHDGTFPQYEIDDVRNIWCRVLCVNRHPTKSFRASFLGPTGHLERMNAWTHILGAVLYFGYGFVRLLIYGGSRNSLSNSLVTLNSFAIVATFGISTIYHVYSANRFWSSITRLGDYFGIYLSISTSYLADLSIVTTNLQRVPYQAVADLWIASGFMVGFWAVRRATMSIDETRKPFMADRCSLGLARSLNVDLEHSSLRAGAGVALAFSWILVIPAGMNTLEADCALVFFACHVVGTLILVLGMALDNMMMFPDVYLNQRDAKQPKCVCYDPRPGACSGWIMTSHAMWHIIALMATVTTSVGVEYVIGNSDVLVGNLTIHDIA